MSELYSRGLIRIDGLTEKQVEFCKNVIKLQNALLPIPYASYPIPHASYDDLLLNEEEEKAAYVFENSTDRRVIGLWHVHDGVFKCTADWYAFIEENENEKALMLRQLELALQACWPARDASEMASLAQEMFEYMMNVPVPSEPKGVYSRILGNEAKELSHFLDTMDMAREKLKVLNLATESLHKVVQRLFSNEDYWGRYIEYAAVGNSIEFWEDESFNVEGMAFLLQVLLDEMDLDMTVYFTYADTDDYTRPDHPGGGAVAVNRWSILTLDSQQVAYNIMPDMIRNTGTRQQSTYGPSGQCHACRYEMAEELDSYVEGDYCSVHEMLCPKCGHEWNNIFVLASRQDTKESG